MERLKTWFILIYMPLSLIAIAHSAWGWLSGGGPIWLTGMFANLPFLLFMGWLMASGKARTSAEGK